MNTLHQYILPQWVSVFFLFVIPIPVILIAFLAQKASHENTKKTVLYSILSFFVVYFSYISIANFSKLFDKVSLPPVILLYTTFPYSLFLFVVVLNLSIYKKIFNNLKLEDLVAVHIFRLIGIFFVILAYYNALPKTFALIAGFGDIITAITSIQVVKLIKRRKPLAKTLVYLWNFFGLIDILFTAITANILTKISIDTGASGVDALAMFPFCFIPAFAPPTIIFLHVMIHQKIKNSFS